MDYYLFRKRGDMRWKRRLTSEEEEKVVRVIRMSEDVSLEALARRFDISNSTIQKINRKYSIRPTQVQKRKEVI